MFEALEFGHFVLHSGQHTNVKIVAEKASPVPSWELIHPGGWWGARPLGVPTGGEWLVAKMGIPLGAVALGAPNMVIDDVWTTGASVREFIAAQGLDPKACLVWVMFLRGDPPPEGEFAGFTYYEDARHLPLWTAEECPFCHEVLVEGFLVVTGGK